VKEDAIAMVHPARQRLKRHHLDGGRPYEQGLVDNMCDAPRPFLL